MKRSVIPICSTHGIPLVHRGGSLSGRKCQRCRKHRLSMRNQCGLCIWCQVEMHLQSASALPGPNTLVCPACAGEATSPRKAAAARKNGKLGGPPMTQRLCRLCKTIHLATHNESGVCRTCQRKYGKPKPEIRLTFA